MARIRNLATMAGIQYEGIFKPAAWRSILLVAGQRMGQMFQERFLPLRWNPSYAQMALGHTSKDGKPFWQRKSAVDKTRWPVHWIQAARSSRVRARATKGVLRVSVSVPTGHPVSSTLSKAFSRIPSSERVELERFLGETISALAEQAATSKRTSLARGSGLIGASRAISAMARQGGFAASNMVLARKLNIIHAKNSTLKTSREFSASRAQEQALARREGFKNQQQKAAFARWGKRLSA